MITRLWRLAPVLAIALVACNSPEAARTRGGGPGADPRNYGAIVETRGGAKVYYRTPCRTEKVKCSGPVPDTGT